MLYIGGENMPIDNNRKAYNPQLVQSCISNFNNAYGELNNVLGQQMQANVIDKIAMGWKSPQAAKYLKQMVEGLAEINKSVHEMYNVMLENINISADNYARAGESVWSKVALAVATAASVDGSKVAESDSDGSIGLVNIASFNEGKAFLANYKQMVGNALDHTKQAVSNTGFVDSGTESSIQNAIEKIRTRINEVIDQFSNTLNTDSETVSANYDDVVSKNTSGN